MEAVIKLRLSAIMLARWKQEAKREGVGTSAFVRHAVEAWIGGGERQAEVRAAVRNVLSAPDPVTVDPPVETLARLKAKLGLRTGTEVEAGVKASPPRPDAPRELDWEDLTPEPVGKCEYKEAAHEPQCGKEEGNRKKRIGTGKYMREHWLCRWHYDVGG